MYRYRRFQKKSFNYKKRKAMAECKVFVLRDEERDEGCRMILVEMMVVTMMMMCWNKRCKWYQRDARNRGARFSSWDDFFVFFSTAQSF